MQLDRLGIVQWHAKTPPEAALRTKSRENLLPRQLESEGTVSDDNWFRLLRRVSGLVRGIINFGVFVQVYVAAAEGERPVKTSRTNNPGDGRTTKTVEAGARVRDGRGFVSGTTRRREQRQRRDTSRSLPKRPNAGTASVEEKKQDDDNDNNDNNISEANKTPPPVLSPPPASDLVLQWLFPPGRGDDGGAARQAFNRHALCGGAVRGLITIESAVTIVRDAGKVLPVEQAWRYWRGGEAAFKSKGDGGDRKRTEPLPSRRLLLGFQDFVDMCEALKSHVTNASMMDEEGCCIVSSASTVRAAAT